MVWILPNGKSSCRIRDFETLKNLAKSCPMPELIVLPIGSEWKPEQSDNDGAAARTDNEDLDLTTKGMHG